VKFDKLSVVNFERQHNLIRLRRMQRSRQESFLINTKPVRYTKNHAFRGFIASLDEITAGLLYSDNIAGLYTISKVYPLSGR